MSPNCLLVATSSYCCGDITSFIEIVSIIASWNHVGVFAGDFSALLGEHPAGQTVDRLLMRRGDLLSLPRACELKRFARDLARSLARDDAHGDGDVAFGRNSGAPATTVSE
jgi:hypothetical protein